MYDRIMIIIFSDIKDKIVKVHGNKLCMLTHASYLAYTKWYILWTNGLVDDVKVPVEN